MRKSYDSSRIPKPVASKTESVRSNESSNSNHDKRLHVGFTKRESSVHAADLRIQIVGDKKAARGRSEMKSKVQTSYSKSNTSNRSRKASKSPQQQKHKILVYEPEGTKAVKTISPYMCDVNRKEGNSSPSDGPFKEMYVSEREFKLLKNAADLQQAAERRLNKSLKAEKTLFGYVTLPEAPTFIASPENASDSSRNAATAKQSHHPAVQSGKNSSQTEEARRPDEKKKPKRESSMGKTQTTQTQAKKSQSNESTTRTCKRRSRQSTTTSDNFTLTNAWDDDLLESDSRLEEYRLFVEKFKEKFNKPFKETSSSPFYPSPPAAPPVEKISRESQTDAGAEVNGNVDKNFSCDLIGQNISDTVSKFPGEDSGDIQSKYSSSVMEATSSKDKDSVSLMGQPSLAERMKRSVMVATEVSLVLMNTLFKDALQDPKSPSRLADSKLFQKFINVETEVEALEKAANIFDSANKCIVGYLQTLSQSSIAYSDTPQEIVDFENISEIPLGKMSLLDAQQFMRNTELSRELGNNIQLKLKANNNVVLGDTDRQTQWNYSSDMEKKPVQMTMSKAQEPGFLVQSIVCQDFEFHLNFVGNTRKVSTLISSSRSKTKSIALTPFQLLDIIDRCLTHIALRLGATNLHLQISSQNLGVVVKDYTDGKHGHYSKSLKRSNAKLQGLNTFAGIVLQITRVVTKISEKLLCSLNILFKLNEILKNKDNDLEVRGQKVQETVQILPPQEALVEVVTILDELENALEIGKNSLSAIYSKSTSDVKMKKCLREILNELFQALLELDTQEGIDFGSLLMSAVSCTGMLCGCVGSPRFDPTIQRNVLTNLNKIKVNIVELQGTSKRMNFVSGYLGSKSLLNLKNNREAAKIMEEKQSHIQSIPWYKRRLFTRVLERTYSMISIPSPVVMLSEDEGDTNLNQTTESSHYSTVSAENESFPTSIINL